MKAIRFFSMSVLGALAIAMASCSGKDKAQKTGDTTTDSNITEVANTVSAGAPIVLAEGDNITPAEGKGVVIDFNATWCPPCKQFAPNFDAVATENSDKALFYSVDVDVHPDLANQYQVEAIPTVIYISADGTVNRSVGYLEKQQFSELVNQYIK